MVNQTDTLQNNPVFAEAYMRNKQIQDSRTIEPKVEGSYIPKHAENATYGGMKWKYDFKVKDFVKA